METGPENGMLNVGYECFPPTQIWASRGKQLRLFVHVTALQQPGTKHSRDFYWINHEWIKHNGDTQHFRWRCKGNKSVSNMFGMDPTQYLVHQCAFHRTYRKTFRKGRRLWGICHFDGNWSFVCLFSIKDHGASCILGQLCTVELHSQLRKFCGSQGFFYLFWFQDSWDTVQLLLTSG